MKLYEFTPKKDIKRLTVTTIAAFAGAAVMMLISIIFPGMAYKWAVQLIGIGLGAVGVFFTSRYIMRAFVYRVEIFDENEGPELTVTEIQGRHVITVCRLTLSSIDDVVTVCPTDKPETDALKARINEEKRKRSDYCVDMFGDKQLCVLAKAGGEGLAVKLSYDAELERLLTPSKPTDDTDQDTQL